MSSPGTSPLETILNAERGVASCGGWLRNRSPREARDPALQALRPGCEELAVTDPAQMPVREARPREPKTATVERREASVPRHGTQGASLGAWPAASCAGPTGVPPSTRTSLGAPPTPRFGVSETKLQTPGAETRRGNEGVRVVDTKPRIISPSGRPRESGDP